MSCKYDSDCDIPMCQFNLTGNNMMDIEGSVTPGGYNIVSSRNNIHSYNHIKVSDGSINNMMWHGQLYNISDYYTNGCQLKGNSTVYIYSEHTCTSLYSDQRC